MQLDSELTGLCEAFMAWEQEERLTEYQNYQVKRTRPSSAVNANSRLLKGTYASRGK